MIGLFFCILATSNRAVRNFKTSAENDDVVIAIVIVVDVVDDGVDNAVDIVVVIVVDGIDDVVDAVIVAVIDDVTVAVDVIVVVVVDVDEIVGEEISDESVVVENQLSLKRSSAVFGDRADL